MKLGEWIKDYRKEHGISMQVMADMCGFSKAYVGMLEKGINPTTKRPISPTMQTFQKIADGVGMDVNELIKVLDSDQPVTVTPTSAPSPEPDRPSYYADPETAEVAERLRTQPGMRMLFDASKDAKPEDLQYAADLLKRLKGDD